MDPSPVELVAGRDPEHPAMFAAGVPTQSPSGRQGTVVLVCLSSMPMLLRDVGVETGVEGDSFMETGQGRIFKEPRAGGRVERLRRGEVHSRS